MNKILSFIGLSLFVTFSLNSYSLDFLNSIYSYQDFNLTPQHIVSKGSFKIAEFIEEINQGNYYLEYLAGSKNSMLGTEKLREFITLDEQFTHVLKKVKDIKQNDFNFMVAIKQSYLMKNVHPRDFGEGIEIFLDPDYQRIVFSGVEQHFEDGLWYSIKYLPWYARLVCSPFVAVNYHEKTNEKHYTEHTREILHKTEFGIPSRIGVTATPHYYFLGNNSKPNLLAPHDKVKASNSVTFYYSVNNNQDTFVVSYQLVLANVPKLGSSMLGKFVNGFVSGIKESIHESRLYFMSKEK